jgi:hypothetical protein
MSRHLYTSLPCWNDDDHDGESFDWKYFLKPLSGKRTVETDDDLVTQPDFGESEPGKCLYHVISQALVHQQHDTENLKSQRVEKLKRKISKKLKPDEFLSPLGKVRRLEKSRSLNTMPSVNKSDLQRSVTDPGISDRKIIDQFVAMGQSLKVHPSDETIESPETASNLSLADSGIDEVDAKMLSPSRSFRRPQLFISPMKGRKPNVQWKSELMGSDEDVDINDNFSILSLLKVKQSESRPSLTFAKKVDSPERKFLKSEDSKNKNKYVVVDLSDSIQLQEAFDVDLSGNSKIGSCPKTCPVDVLSFDVIPPRISRKTNSTKESIHGLQSSLNKDGVEVANIKMEKVLNESDATKEGTEKTLLGSEIFDLDETAAVVIGEKSDLGVSVGTGLLISKTGSSVADLLESGVKEKQYSDVKKANAGLEEFHNVEEMYEKYTAIKNIRPDLQNSASRWTIPVLQRYIKKQYIDLIEPMMPKESCQLSKKERAHLKKQMIDQSILMFSPGRHFTKAYPQFGEFQNWRIQEADIRLFLNVICRRLCLKLHMQMKVEERITGDNLPNAVCDYAFYKKDVCVGLLEAKSPSALEPRAVPQFLVELLNIQARYGSPDLSFFGILSDAHRFVFINLMGVKFSLEQTEMMQIRIHEVFSWNDMFAVADVILHNFHQQNQVLKECLQSESVGGADSSEDSDVMILE